MSFYRYPIYRIPTGPTLKDLDACFLTYHTLHTPLTGNYATSSLCFAAVASWLYIALLLA
jgi:hypothetical protein